MASSSPPAEKNAPSAAASSTSSMKSPGSVAFSSAPVAPVVVNSHNRRQSEAASWSQTPAALAVGGGGHTNTRQQPRQRSGGGSRGSSPGSYGSSEPSDASGDEEERSQHREHQSSASLSLPAISGAALLQLRSGNSSIQPADKRGDAQYASGGNGAGGMIAPGRSSGYYRRSRSRSRELPDPADVPNRWRNAKPQPSTTSNQSDTSSKAHPHMPQHESNIREDAGSPAFSTSSGMRGSADPSSPDDREVRIMFHGREIYADDLIGLRVAKTFVGHGRFLGQVVKFDEPTSLYTIVYADGDAEELNIDSTIQILIQDEIERADPSLPPVSSTYAKEAYPMSNSPESTSTSAPSGMPQAPPPQSSLQQCPAPPPLAQHAPPPPSSSRPLVQISEREAQFVVGLFENHALPALLRDGWHIQTSASGTEQRFFAPPGNFPGAGGVFPTALSVVELIASDGDLLSMCFPTNVHSAILSLFPESSRVLRESSHPRKRASSGRGDADAYDGKRQRAVREDGGHGSTASQMRGVAPLNPRPRGMNVEQSRGSYPLDEMHRERDREPYARIDLAQDVSKGFRTEVEMITDAVFHQATRCVELRPILRATPDGTEMMAAGMMDLMPPTTVNEHTWIRPSGGIAKWRRLEVVRMHRLRQRHTRMAFPTECRIEPTSSTAIDRNHIQPCDQVQIDRRIDTTTLLSAEAPVISNSQCIAAFRLGVDRFRRRRRTIKDSHLAMNHPQNIETQEVRVTAMWHAVGIQMVGQPHSVNNRGPSFSMMDVDRNSHPRVGIPSSSTSLMEHARSVSDSGKHPKWDSQHQQHRRPEQQDYDQQRGRSPHVNESGSNQGYAPPPPGHHHRHHGHHQVPAQHHRQHHHQRSASSFDSNTGSSASSSTVATGGRVPMTDQRSGSPGNNQNTIADAPPAPRQM
uniref:PTM/DIR17-like Tudor domain-containing protein n=1 Tax=Globisporangium ultimum (strain ATCC 200006 / CBS 805.95 / DAOM BR144) TaxID=431595 RepID=K3W7F0_GLOUD